MFKLLGFLWFAMGWWPWKSNGQEIIKSLQDEVTLNIALLQSGKLLQTMAWDAAVQTRKTSLLGDAAYAAQLAYVAVDAFNTALVAYNQNFLQRSPDRPAPAPGEREACEAFLANQRNQLLEKFGGLKKDLQARVGS